MKMNRLSLTLLLVFCILFDADVVQSAELDCSGFSDVTNGCSVPDYLPSVYIDVFTPACTRHDVCYTCGIHQNHNFSRKKCDRRFKRQMNKACRKQTGWLNKTLCHAEKKLYYKAVRNFGHENYNSNTTHLDERCQHDWVSRCMRK